MDLPQKNRTIITISLLTIVVCVIVMLGWLLNIPALASILPGFIAMRFNAALCFILFACALLLSQYQSNTYKTPFFFALSLLATIIAFATIYQDFFHVTIGIDQLFVADKASDPKIIPFAGRMAFNASVNFCLLGIGFLLLNRKGLVTIVTAQCFFHAVTILSGVALIGYVYGVALFSSLFFVTTMALITAILFFTLSIAASLLNPTVGITGLFTGKRIGNKMARRLFGLILVMIILFGSIRSEANLSKVFSSMNLGISLLAITFLLVSLLIIWNTANWLNKIDVQRNKAEAEVRIMNARLEKRVEESSAELKEAELKFRTIAEKSMVGVYIVQHGVFAYVNPRFAEVFGYNPEDLVNVPEAGPKIFHDTYRDVVAENLRRRFSGEIESLRYEARGVKKDGTPNWVEIYGNAVTIGGAPAIIGSMIDITERKRAEEELISSELKYKLLFQSSPVPMWMIAKDNMQIIAVNEAAASHYGYTTDELLHLDTKIFRPEEDAKEQLETYLKEINGTRVVRHLKKNGEMIYVEITSHDIVFEGRPVRLSLTIDITEKLKAQESLQKSEANLQAILKTTDTAYALFDKDLKVLTFNQKAIEFVKAQYGHTPKKGFSLPDYFPENKFPELNRFAKDALQGNNISYEDSYPQADGTVHWYYVRMFPITNDNKEIIGILMALYDITERKNAEQDLQSAYGRIQNHMDSIKDMAWKQSHLIRSPLANLKGLTSILQNDIEDTEILDHILTELDRMDSIIIEMANDASGHDV